MSKSPVLLKKGVSRGVQVNLITESLRATRIGSKMQGNGNGVSMIPDSDKQTKLKITRSSQMLKKELNKIGNEHSKALSKINRCMEEAKHSMRSWRNENESCQSFPQKRVSRPVRQSSRASSGVHGTSRSGGVRKETPTPGFELPQLVDKGQGDGLTEDITEQNPDIESLGYTCQSFELSTGDAADARNQDEELERKEDERLQSGAEESKFGNQIETKEEMPNLLELGTACSKNSKLLGRRASTSNILFPASSRADLVLKKTEVNTISPRMNRVRKLSDPSSRSSRSSLCGITVSAASGMQPKTPSRARRSSVAVMTTSTTSLFDSLQLQSKTTLSRPPSEPSLSPQISPRYNLSLERSSNARERKQASEEAAVHESLLKIGRRMVAPMTGAELEGRLRARRHSIQYPLVPPPATAGVATSSTSESDLFSGLENCRYLRRPSKEDVG